MKRAARRPGYHRLRPKEGRVIQGVWDVMMGARKMLSAREIADRSGASVWTVRNFLKRCEREGLVRRDGPQARDGAARYVATRWKVAVRLGRVAPILHGHISTGEGFTDPDKAGK